MAECTCPNCGHVFESKGKQPKSFPEEWKELCARWNKFADAKGLPMVRPANTTVKKKFDMRFRDASKTPEAVAEWWSDLRDACAVIAGTPFYLGENDTGWSASLDYLMRPGKLEELSNKYKAMKKREAAHAPTLPSPVEDPLDGDEPEPNTGRTGFASNAPRVGSPGRNLSQ